MLVLGFECHVGDGFDSDIAFAFVPEFYGDNWCCFEFGVDIEFSLALIGILKLNLFFGLKLFWGLMLIVGLILLLCSNIILRVVLLGF